MHAAVIVFPGSNCDRDVAVSLTQAMGRKPAMVWHGDADVPKIKAAMMLHYADPTKDTGIGARIPGYEAALKANGKNYQLFIYEGAQHGFHNDTTPRYDEAAAKLAWTRSLDHFNKYVRG